MVPQFNISRICGALLCAGNLVAVEKALLQPGDTWSYVIGHEEPAAEWNQPEFDDAGWLRGVSGFSRGFSVYDEATRLPGLTDGYFSAYFRKSFVVTNLADIVWPTLRIDYDDGFVAFLNGQEIARRGITGSAGDFVPHNAVASTRVRSEAEEVDLYDYRQQFVQGTNWLAIQLHGSSLSDTTMALVPELLSGITRGPFLQNTSTNRTLIIWKTAVPADSIVEYGLTEQLGQTVGLATLTNTHVMELSGLSEDTDYFYRVKSTRGQEMVVSEPVSFRTLKSSGRAHFLVIGDSGVGQIPQYEIASLMSGRDADFVVHAGDIVYPKFTSGRVDPKLFSVYSERLRSVPWFFALGNHDLYAGESHYLDSFYLPTNSVTGTEHFYSFDHGDVHVAVLMIPYAYQYKLTVGDDQYRWLTNDLATTTKPWKVLVYHVPIQTSSSHRADDKDVNGLVDRFEVRDVLLPVADQFGVQVTFSGHDHVFEKFAPTNGVHTITTGGGGVGLYGFNERDAASVKLWSRHHYVDVQTVGNRMEIKAIDRFGNEFDSLTIYNTPPVNAIVESIWNTPVVESAPSNDGDGNISGQRLDLVGMSMGTVPGEFSNLGEVFVNNDKQNFYLGFSNLLLRDDSLVYLFIDAPGLTGVAHMEGVGNGMIDPDAQGADGLDLLENLSFTDFSPAIGLILGDETADTTYRSFQRPGSDLNTGQGAYLLNASLDQAASVRVHQFNLSPQTGLVSYEQNADFIEICLPYSTLGGVRPGDTVRIGAVVAGAGHDFINQRQRLDTAYLGAAMSGNGTNEVSLTGLQVQLALDPDRDGDGLPNDWEIANDLNPDSDIGVDGADGDIDDDGDRNQHEFLAGTDPRDAQSVFTMWLNPLSATQLEIRWKTVPGLQYSLESAETGNVTFLPLDPAYFPRVATGVVESFTNELTGGGQLFRVKRVQ